MGGTVTAAQALLGGTSSAVHVLTLRLPNVQTEWVLHRRYVRPELNEEEPDIAERFGRYHHAPAKRQSGLFPSITGPTYSAEARSLPWRTRVQPGRRVGTLVLPDVARGSKCSLGRA